MEKNLNGIKYIYDNLIGVIFTDNTLNEVFDAIKVMKRMNMKKMHDSVIKGHDDFTYFSIEDSLPIIISNLEIHEIDILRKAFFIMSKSQIENIMYPIKMFYELK